MVAFWRFLACLGLLVSIGVAMAADGDGDGIDDLFDNCVNAPNPAQINSDFDAFGNACDGDVNQDGTTDATDRNLIAGEVGDPSPRPLADLTGDGTVDSVDLAWFDDELVGLAPGPAGSMAHDADGDGRLDFCSESPYHACMATCSDSFSVCDATCRPGGPSFAHRRDPAVQPDLLANGPLSGDPPFGWNLPNQTYIDYSPDVFRSGDRSVQWLAWGGSGHGGGNLCGSSCLQPDPIPVDDTKAYAYSFYVCTAEFPPTTMSMVFSEFDANDVYLGNVGPLNNSKFLGSSVGQWEEVVVFYEPSSADVAKVQPKIFRKTGPGGARNTLFADDFAFWQLDDEGVRTYRSPPSPKTPFDGARTRIDALGNAEVLTANGWQEFFPVAIYSDFRQDPSVYSDAGYNVIMNERGFGVEADDAIDAISAFNPDGMRFMFTSHTWHDPDPGDLALSTALDNLTTKRSPKRDILLWDRLFAFNYDNEIFSSCGTEDDITETCVARMWEAQIAPLAEIFARDRLQNGGVRGVPSYFLNGNPNVARAYDKALSVVNLEGDVRMDVTGSYRSANLAHLDRIEGQTAPAITTQIQTTVGDRYSAIAWGGIALGARMLGTWRDWAPTLGSHGELRSGPRLNLCGATDFGLAPRLNYFNPPGQIVEGATSLARAEILSNAAAFNGCSGDGASYTVHLVQGEFVSGESLRDAGTGTPITGSTVDSVTGSPLVDYKITVAQRGWFADVPQLRREIDALMPILREDHRTSWNASCDASVPDLGNVDARFGDDGIICGGRTHEGQAYLILSNTHHDIDPYAAWDEQIFGRELSVSVDLSATPYAVQSARRFDPVQLAFIDQDSLDVTADTFSISLAPLDAVVLWLDAATGAAPSRASDSASGMTPMLATGFDSTSNLVDLAYDPACGASDHALHVGPLATVSEYVYDDVICGLGASGTASVDVGPGNRFWLIAGRTANHEGGTGLAPNGLERPAPSLQLGCALPRLLGSECP